MAAFSKKAIRLSEQPGKRLWHEIYHMGSFAAGFLGVFYMYSKLAPFPNAESTPFGKDYIVPWLEKAIHEERNRNDYGAMVIKYQQNPEIIIANQHRSKYIPYVERHLLAHNIDKRPAGDKPAQAETAAHTLH